MSESAPVFHGTTIVCVRRGDQVAIGGDGQVTLGHVVIKGTARKVRKWRICLRSCTAAF